MFKSKKLLFSLVLIVLFLMLLSTQAMAADNRSEADIKSACPFSFVNVSSQENVALVASYPNGTFFYTESGNWILLTPSVAYAMAFTDITGDGYCNFIASFDSGTWYVDTTGNWNLLTRARAIAMASDHGDEFYASFPSGTWTYGYEFGWERISTAVAHEMTMAFVVDDGYPELVASFNSGTWYMEWWWDDPYGWDWRWSRLTPSRATALVGYLDGNNDSLIHAVFPSGFWDYYPMKNDWTHWGGSNVTCMAIADMNNDNFPNLITTHYQGTWYLLWYEESPGQWNFNWHMITPHQAISMQGINIYPFSIK